MRQQAGKIRRLQESHQESSHQESHIGCERLATGAAAHSSKMSFARVPVGDKFNGPLHFLAQLICVARSSAGELHGEVQGSAASHASLTAQ